jgi:large repetitive protein
MKHIATAFLVVLAFLPSSLLANTDDPTAIVKQPNDITQCVGGVEKLMVVTTSEDVTFQWQSSEDNKFWKNVSGATEATFYPTSKTTSQLWYRVVVSDKKEGKKEDKKTAISKSALVKIAELPRLSVSVVEGMMCTDKDITFKAAIVGGAGDCTFQWQKSTDGSAWNDIDGAKSETYKAAMGSGIKYRITSKCSGSGCCN